MKILEAIIPIPSRMIIIKNRVSKQGEEILSDILPRTSKTHNNATKRAKKFIKDCHQTDYRTDSRIIKTEKWGQILISFTQFYWYKGLSPEVSTITFNYGDATQIEAYDYIVDTKTFSKEISKLYKTKVAAKTFIPISAKNTEEQQKFPRLVELGNWAKKFFNSLPIVQDRSPQGMGNSMSSLFLPEDVKRLYDFQFFEWNQWVEAEYYAKSNLKLGYDVYRGINSLKDDSIMIYILKNKEPAPLPIFNRKYFNKRGMSSQSTSGATKLGKGKGSFW